VFLTLKNTEGIAVADVNLLATGEARYQEMHKYRNTDIRLSTIMTIDDVTNLDIRYR